LLGVSGTGRCCQSDRHDKAEPNCERCTVAK
jgi:hypothetical protein